ncbi:MAG: C_GCAxxG_C_C family protein [Eubacterium sp.]|nr:C_GCAxxG_C_C family protein [Eubacterium sp.]
MSKYMDNAKALRERTDIHINCAQAVIMAFTKDLGLDEEASYRIAANFGSGMKMGATCGAITGALMTLGLAGIDDSAGLLRQARENHDGLTDCRDLLRVNAQTGTPKKQHCDGMVYELVELTEAILKEQGVLE